jgi:hypothetical protein
MMEALSKFGNAAWPFISHGLTAVISAWAAYFFTAKHFKKQKWHEFEQRRLDEFYGPMLGLIKQIRANAEARVKASAASNEAWREICERHPKPFLDHDKYFEPFQKGIEYENQRFKETDLPAYSQMQEIFKSKLFLAYPSTKEWFDQFTQYIDHWHRPFPPEALMKLNISEEPLLEFYDDLERHADDLRRKLSGEESV